MFDCNTYFKERKVKLAVVEFTDYTIVWWINCQLVEEDVVSKPLVLGQN